MLNQPVLGPAATAHLPQTFSNNSAPAGLGGGVAITPAVRFADFRVAAVSASDTKFVNCSALSGGSFYATGTNATFSRASFANCSATGGALPSDSADAPSGGGAAALVNSSARFSSSVFEDNAASVRPRQDISTRRLVKSRPPRTLLSRRGVLVAAPLLSPCYCGRSSCFFPVLNAWNARRLTAVLCSWSVPRWF